MVSEIAELLTLPWYQ